MSSPNLSAKTVKALEQQCVNLSTYLTNHTVSLARVAYTLNLGRAAFQYRLAIVSKDAQDAIKQINNRHKLNHSGAVKSPKVAFIFSGQGDDFYRASQELLIEEPKFKKYIDECADIVKEKVIGGHTTCFVREKALMMCKYLWKTLCFYNLLCLRLNTL